MYLCLFFATINAETKYISSITVEGNINIKTTDILDIINTKNPKIFFKDIFNSRKLHIDKIKLKNHYSSLGFLEVNIEYEIEYIDDTNIEIKFIIVEGIQYKVNSISIFGNNIFSTSEILNVIGMKNKDIYNPIKLNETLKNIKNKYLEKGKALVKIVEEIYKEDNKINIRVNIFEGDTYTIGNIEIESNKDINTKHIFRELLFKKGDKYNYNNILKSQRRIYTSNIFSSVEIKKNIDKKNKLVNIIIKVRTGDSGNIVGEFGFGQTASALGDDASPISIIQGGGKWNISQIFNTGLKFSIDSNIGVRLDDKISLSSKKFELSFFSPWIYNFRLPINVKYYFDESKEQGFLRRQGLRTSFLYKQGNNYKLNGKVDIEYIQDNITNNSIEQERSIEIDYIYYTINDFINPNFGSYFASKIDFRGLFLGGSRNYLKLENEYKYFFPIYNYATFALRSKIGYLYDFSNANTIDNLPFYDRLYLGGSTSLRAWGESELNQVGGYLKQLINLEVRIPIYSIVGAELFLDIGKIINEYTNKNQGYDWNAGYGITFMTPIGPLRLDVAYKYGYGKPKITNALLFIF